MLKRLGFYTGKLYDSSIDPASIEECCIILHYKESIREDDEVVLNKKKILKERCVGCFGCGESRKGALPIG